MTNPGESIVNSPETVSLLRSQWRRYQKSLGLTPTRIKVDTTTNAVEVFYLSESKTNDFMDPHYNRLETTISNGQLQLLKQRFREVTEEGQFVTFRGEYTNPSTLRPIRPDGSAIVTNENRFYQAIVPGSGNRIEKFGKDQDAGMLPAGTRIGYQCTCADYMGRTHRLDIYALGDFVRTWSNMGEMGGCKHLLSFRTIVEDLEPPSDIPMAITEAEKLAIGVKSRKSPGNIALIKPKSARFV